MNRGSTSTRANASADAAFERCLRCGLPDRNPSSVSIEGSSSLTDCLKARVASVRRICFAHGNSSAGLAGEQTKMRRRLGVLPGPLALYGPVIVMVEMPPPPRSGALKMSSRVAVSAARTGCGADGVRTGWNGHAHAPRPRHRNGLPSIVKSTRPAPARISYSASSGKLCRAIIPPCVPSGMPSRWLRCDKPFGAR